MGVDVGGAANAVAPRTQRISARCGNGVARRSRGGRKLAKKKTKPKYNQGSILKCSDLSNKTFRKMLRGTGIQFECSSQGVGSMGLSFGSVHGVSLRLCAAVAT